MRSNELQPFGLGYVGSVALALASLAACTLGELSPVGTPPQVSPPDVGESDPSRAIESAAEQVLASVTEGTMGALVVAEPVADEANVAAQSCDSSEVDADAARDTVDAGIGHVLRNSPNCVSFAWEGLSVTIAFAGCALSDGTPLDGELGMSLSFRPLTYRVELTELSIGNTTFDGRASLTMNDDHRSATLALNLAVDNSVRHASLGIFDASITLGDARIVANGPARIDAPTFHGFAQVTDVSWKKHACWPTAGTVEFEFNGTPVVVTFLDETPVTGTVLLSSGYEEESPVRLLDPCAVRG